MAVTRELFSDCGVPDPHIEADRIVSLATGIDRAMMHAHPERVLTRAEFANAVQYGVRRATGEPTAYIVGTSYFCGHELAVDPHVLIPRTETERLVELAWSAALRIGDSGVFADWCTGSGCIAAVMLSRLPEWRCLAVDASSKALDVARENARRLGVEDRVSFVCCSDPADAEDAAGAPLDLIVSNPPYIPSTDIETLEPQVRGFEPRLALDGGMDGLDIVRLLLERLPALARDGAPILLETAGADQIRAIRDIADRCSAQVRFEGGETDHRGIERFALLTARRARPDSGSW